MRRRDSRSALTLLAVFALIIGWADERLSAAMVWRFPPINELVVTENYLGDIGALLIGAHRLAADVAYVQLLQYYGTRKHADSDEEEVDTPDPGISAAERARLYKLSTGDYPRLQELATRIVRLDPFFNGVILEAAGVLAFNVRRVDESLSLLREAIERDPAYFRYNLYVSAILYKEKGNDEGMIGLLMEAMKYPDCPPLVQLVLGNLLKKVGRPLDAAHVYLHTFQTAHKEEDKADALKRLKRVCAENPTVARQIGAELPAN
jgi:tetratricopeptide (TPR) repeat protein